MPYFNGGIGVTDDSHVEVEVPAKELVNHTCRHGYISQNIIAICEFDMRFIFLLLVGQVLHMTHGSSVMP